MIAKIDIAPMAHRYQISWGVVVFVMVNMVNRKSIARFFLRLTAVLASIVVTFSDLCFECVVKFIRIGFIGDTPLPGMMIFANRPGIKACLITEKMLVLFDVGRPSLQFLTAISTLNFNFI